MKVERLRDTEDHITKEAVEKSSTVVVEAGTVLLVVRSGILKHTLPVTVTERPAAINQDLKALSVRADILPEYIAWAFRAFSREILHTCSKAGTTVQSIVFSRLKEFQIPVAPLPEQRRIVEAIEEHFSRLDAAQNSLQADVRRLDTLKAVLLSEAFAGDWPTTKLGDISETLQYGWTSRSTAKTTEYRYLRITDMTSGVVDWSKVPFCLDVPADPTRFLLLEDDILIARSGATFGRSIRVQKPEPAVFASYLIRLRPTGTGLASFIEWFLRSPLYWRQVNASSSGIAQPNVNARKLARIQIPLPPSAQQHAIVESLETSWTLASALRETLQTCRSRAAALRTAILREAFNGRLVQQKPADEPTSAHLAGVGG
jgi:restriction endonuclease S subunit